MMNKFPAAICAARRRQKGATLLVAMVFLLIFGVMAASALSGSMTSARASGNMEWRNEAVNAANDTIDRLLSSTEFADRASVVTARINEAPQQTDVNGDGVADVNVTFPDVTVGGVTRRGPRCIRARPVPVSSLDPGNPDDTVCYGGQDPNSTGISGGSFKTPEPGTCSNTEWMLTVQADDTVTRTSVQVTQGVGMRALRNVAENYCR